MNLRLSTALALTAAFAAFAGLPAMAAQGSVMLTLKDHRFTPATLTVPAGERVQIVLLNQDKATEEFDSHDLKIEKLVTPSGRVTFSIGPLKPGAYSFMGEFHPDTAQGRVVAQDVRP